MQGSLASVYGSPKSELPSTTRSPGFRTITLVPRAIFWVPVARIWRAPVQLSWSEVGASDMVITVITSLSLVTIAPPVLSASINLRGECHVTMQMKASTKNED